MELLGRQNNVGFMYYGPNLRESRRMLNSELNPSSVRKWEPLVEETLQDLMKRFSALDGTSDGNIRDVLRR